MNISNATKYQLTNWWNTSQIVLLTTLCRQCVSVSVACIMVQKMKGFSFYKLWDYSKIRIKQAFDSNL
jgi:hypothetical protein